MSHTESQIVFRQAMLDDAPAMAAVDALSWPPALAVPEETVRARIRSYPQGQQVVLVDGELAGVSSAQRITESFLAAHSDSYDAVTDCDRFTASHDPAGEIYELVGVGVNPAFRGLNLGRRLVDRQIAFARSLPGVRRIVGFTRPAKYARQAELPIDAYLQQRKRNGRIADPVLAFHLHAGARIVSTHKNFRPNDADSCGYGILIEYP